MIWYHFIWILNHVDIQNKLRTSFTFIRESKEQLISVPLHLCRLEFSELKEI